MTRYVLLLLLLCSIHFTSTAQKNHLKIGQIPPDLMVTVFNPSLSIVYRGETFRDTVYLIDFWATWCAPCIESIPHMDSLIERYRGKKVKFISITYEPKDLVERFLLEHPMKSTVALDNDFAMFRKYNAWAIPNIVMINAEGKIAGRIHPNKLTEQVIDKLIAGEIPDVSNTKEDMFDPAGAEQYFRSLLEKKK